MADDIISEVSGFKKLNYSNSDLNNLLSTGENIYLFYGNQYGGLRVKHGNDFINLIRITRDDNNEITQINLGDYNKNVYFNNGRFTNLKIDDTIFSSNIGESSQKIDNGYFDNLNVNNLNSKTEYLNIKLDGSTFFDSINSNDIELIKILPSDEDCDYCGYCVKRNGMVQFRLYWSNKNEIQLNATTGKISSGSILIGKVKQEYRPYFTSLGIGDNKSTEVNGSYNYRIIGDTSTNETGNIYLNAIVGSASNPIPAGKKFLFNAVYIAKHQ